MCLCRCYHGVFYGLFAVVLGVLGMLHARAAEFQDVLLQPDGSERIQVADLEGEHLATVGCRNGTIASIPLNLVSAKAFPAGSYRLRLHLRPSHGHDMAAWAGGLEVDVGGDELLTNARWSGISFGERHVLEVRTFDFIHRTNRPLSINLQAHVSQERLMETATSGDAEGTAEEAPLGDDEEEDELGLELIAQVDAKHSFYYILERAELLPISKSVAVTSVRVDKIFYRPGDTVRANVRLRRVAEQAQGTMHVVLERGLGERSVVEKRPLQLSEKETVVQIDVPLPERKFGGAVIAEFHEDAGGVSSARDVFTVSDNLWEVAIGADGGGPLGNTAPYDEAQMVAFLKNMRDRYCNWFEKNFWAPDDWGQMTAAPGATWFSGQARRHENTEKLQFLIREAHKHGIQAISYGKCMAGGPPGWERARRLPQWFTVDQYGRTIGRPGDVWDLDNWNAPGTAYEDYKYIWSYRWVDTRVPAALDHGIDQLVAAQRQFGWDGVRFDSGGFRAHHIDGKHDGNDAWNTHIQKRLKKRIGETLPGWLLGYNTNNTAALGGRTCPLSPDDPISHEMREMLAGGGLWMNEAIREWHNGSVHYETWKRFAEDEVRCIRTIKHYGGHMCFVYGDADPAHITYKFVLGTLMGAHDYQGGNVRAGGCANWGRFLTRWGGFLWDARLRPAAEAVLVAPADALWWREFTTERVVSPTRRYVIGHLFNPPVQAAIADTKYELPKPVRDCQLSLTIPDGQTLEGAWLLSPDRLDDATPLEVMQDGQHAKVTVPRVELWAMVVWRLQGDFEVPAPPSSFTESLSDAEIAEMARLKVVPNVPVADDILAPTSVHEPSLQAKPVDQPTVGKPDDYRIGGAAGTDVLLLQGHYHKHYGVPDAIAAAASDARVVAKTARDLPRTHAAFAAYDVIVMINLEANLWRANGQQALVDWVKAGGRLVVLGGNFTLGQGFFRGSLLDPVLPGEVRVARDVYALPAPLALGAAQDKPFPGNPMLYFYHALKSRPGVEVKLWAGKLPLFVEHAVEKGSCAVFVGTVLGDKREKETPFWDWQAWPKTLGSLLLGE